MHQLFVRQVYLLLTMFCLTTLILGQNTNPNDLIGKVTAAPNSHMIRGKIFLPNGHVSARPLRVVLETSTGTVVAEVFSNAEGTFEFRSLVSNDYRVIVSSDGATYETTQSDIKVSGTISSTFSALIYLREKKSVEKPSNERMVPAFGQDVPKNAQKNFELGAKKLKEGKNDEAFAALQAAIKDFPDYVMAHDRLGQYYLGQQKFPEAQAEFEKALAINTNFALSHLNLGILFTQQKHFDAALEQLVAALRLDENYPMGHLYLGMVLLEQAAQHPKNLVLAEHAFRRAIALGGNTMAQAHKYIFNIQMRRKDYSKAVVELEAYLAAAPKASDAPQIKAMIEQLKQAIADQASTAKPQ